MLHAVAVPTLESRREDETEAWRATARLMLLLSLAACRRLLGLASLVERLKATLLFGPLPPVPAPYAPDPD